MKMLGIAGSLRRESYNKKLLVHAGRVATGKGADFRTADIGDLPVLNEDLEVGGKRPDAVEKFRAELEWADAIVIATPEYNNSVPGGLKNAIDWGSRAPNCWNGKVVAVMGATVGNFGTVLAQADLRKILLILNTIVVPSRSCMFPGSRTRFRPTVRLPTRRPQRASTDLFNGFWRSPPLFRTPDRAKIHKHHRWLWITPAGTTGCAYLREIAVKSATRSQNPLAFYRLFPKVVRNAEKGGGLV